MSRISTDKGPQGGQRTSNPLPLNKRLYDLKEAAVYLGRPVFSVRTLIWNGALPVIKDGRKFYLDIHDMNEYVEKNRIRVA